MKIGDIVYSIEYDYFGKLIEINGNEAVLDTITREPLNGPDIMYCNINKCKSATEEQLIELFEI